MAHRKDLAVMCADIAVNHPVSKWGKTSEIEGMGGMEGYIFEDGILRITHIAPTYDISLVYGMENDYLVYTATISWADDEKDKKWPEIKENVDCYSYWVRRVRQIHQELLPNLGEQLEFPFFRIPKIRLVVKNPPKHSLSQLAFKF